MVYWYSKINSAPEGDYTVLVDALDWFETEYQKGREEIKLKGRLEDCAKRLPGLVEYYYRHLQELDAILQWFEISIHKVYVKHKIRYLEHYNRSLSEKSAGERAEAEQEYIDLKLLYNQVGLMRNQFFGIHKALDASNFQLSNIVALRKAGIEDATI